MNRHEDFCCDSNCKMCNVEVVWTPPKSLEDALMEEREASAAYDKRVAERDKYDEEYYSKYVEPTPYENWIEGAQYLTKEELADRYARYGIALSEIHDMALSSFCGKKDLPDSKYMLGLCLGLAGGALNYDFGANKPTT